MAHPSATLASIESPKAKAWDPLSSLVLIVFAILGIGFAGIMAPLQVRDEQGHFVRAYLLTRGEFIGAIHAKVPPSILEFLHRLPEGFNTWEKISWSGPLSGAGATDPVDPAEWQTVVDDPKHKYLTTTILGASAYFPLVYLPASTGILVARILHLPPLGMLYAGRVFNVVAVLIGLAIAFYLAPAYRALFSVIALMPMTLGQAGGVTADAVTIAISLVGFALILHVRDRGPNPRLLAVVLVVFAFWGLCKSSVWALPLILLIPSSAFTGKKQRVLYTIAVAVAMLGAIGLWQLFTVESVNALRESRLSLNVDMSANMNILTRHPLQFASWLVECIRANAHAYANQFVGAFGWAKISLPTWIRAVYLSLIAVVAFSEYAPKKFSRPDRGILMLIFVGAIVATHAIIFVLDGPRRGDISAVQGRYFIPFCFAGLLAIRQRKFTIPSNILMAIILCAGAAEGMLALRNIWTYYYL